MYGNIPPKYGLIWYSTSILGSWNSLKFPLNQGIPEWLDQSWPILRPLGAAHLPKLHGQLRFFGFWVGQLFLHGCCAALFCGDLWGIQTIWDHKWMAFFSQKNCIFADICWPNSMAMLMQVRLDAYNLDQADLARIEQQQLVNKIIRILGVTLKIHPFLSSSSQPAQMEHQCWLVVSTILKNMSSSMGRHPIYEMENKIHVWNHQSECIYCIPNFNFCRTGLCRTACPLQSHGGGEVQDGVAPKMLRRSMVYSNGFMPEMTNIIQHVCFLWELLNHYFF